MKIYKAIIVGGGPSGISCSYHLKHAGIEHLIIEKNEMLHTWKHERWDSFHLVTPNWMTNLPGVDHLIPYNNEFMSKAEIEDVLIQYMYYVKPNYIENTTITHVNKEDGYYSLKTDTGMFYAEHIIVATGMFNKPFIPKLSEMLSKDVYQLHSQVYKNPSQLKPGNTLVVGAGRSGIQIALEIQSKLKCRTFLSVGSFTPLPTIYKNINGVYWLNRLSGYSTEKERLPYTNRDMLNKNILHKISQNLSKCQEAGVKILGRMQEVNGDELVFSDDLDRTLSTGESYLRKLERKINSIVKGEDASKTHDLSFDDKMTELDIAPPTILNIEGDEIRNVIWCTGFKSDYKWLTLDVFNEDGSLALLDGVRTKENVYFCGMGLQPDPDTKSSFGVGLFALVESAERAVKALIEQL